MSNEPGVDTVATVEVDFERKQDDHPVDPLGDLADAPAAPGPHLRTDVVENGNPLGVCHARQAQVEIRKIDEDHQRRTPATD